MNKKITTRKFNLVAGILMALTLIACGGGGGSNTQGLTAIAYSGKTTSADISDTNTQDYAGGILEGSQDSNKNKDFFGSFAGITSTGTSDSDNYLALSTLGKLIRDRFENRINTGLFSAVTTEEVGNCGGRVISDDNATGGTARFENYCTSSGSITIRLNGSLSVNVSYYSGTTVVQSLSLSVHRLQMSIVTSSNSFSSDYSGEMSISFNPDGTFDNMSVSTNFIFNGRIYRIVNLNYDNAVGVTISGTIYHPDYGYVTFNTDPANKFNLYGDKLCGGTIVISGAGSSTVSITANADCSQYTYSGTDKDGISFNGIFNVL